MILTKIDICMLIVVGLLLCIQDAYACGYGEDTETISIKPMQIHSTI